MRSWLTMAGIPAAIYTVQNLASLLAYQNLEALTFNVLNQTKTLSAALCCYLVMGKRQTKIQSLSLIMLLVSALVIEKVVSFGSIVSLLGNGVAIMSKGRRFTHGVLPCLFASFLSGLAGALTQKNLQGVTKAPSVDGIKPKPINPYLFSMELTVASVLVLTTSLFFSQDGKQIGQHGFFHLWTPKTMIPILTNSFGGILAYEYLKKERTGCVSLLLGSTPTSPKLIQEECFRLDQEIRNTDSTNKTSDNSGHDGNDEAAEKEETTKPKRLQRFSEAFLQTHECRLPALPLVLTDALAQAGPPGWRGAPAIIDYEALEPLSGIPTLVLVGEYDFCTPACTEGWKIILSDPSPEFVSLDNCSHYGMLEDESKYGIAITSFVQQHDTAKE
jgi:UDP-sugar transporter A1/2/3